MKYSIFHTSHCGSTLLAALLSKSIESYSEPPWSHDLDNIYNIKDRLESIKENQPENSIVKFSSAYCSLMPSIKDKKIFLYNKLYHHLKKHEANQKGLEFQSRVMRNFFHPLSRRQVYPVGQAAGEKAYLWADRFYYAFDSDNTIFINCEDLFKNQNYVLNKICAFLEIEYVPVSIDFHTKAAGLIHKGYPINLDDVLPDNKIKKIEPYIPFSKDLLDWCYETYGAKGLISSFIF